MATFYSHVQSLPGYIILLCNSNFRQINSDIFYLDSTWLNSKHTSIVKAVINLGVAYI